ncbi:hypothetical protein PMAYCL1PPCAC_08316, partial [Pristionchus mayeri]
RHLKEKHSTTPTLAGYRLRCDCGHESYLCYRSSECVISNMTVIREGNTLIRTPQCVLCEIHLKTACGYIQHLTKHHKETLVANGVYIHCSCGMKDSCESYKKEHGKKCFGRELTLHKLDED